MKLSDFALRAVSSPDLSAKLEALPEGWTDDDRVREPVPSWPARQASMEIQPGKKAKVPSLEGWADPSQRARILHALANHELQAVELFAWALLTFPEAPAAFRRGLAGVLADEQRHTRMYLGRLRAHGHAFGDFPVSGHFWRKVSGIRSPAGFVCSMSLTFENANLDHTLESADAARAGGDPASAAVIETVRRDEVEHVRFGWRWLARLKREDQTMWEAYRENLSEPLHPGRASGRDFDPEARRAAGLDDAFIEQLAREHEHTGAGGHRLDRPGGQPIRCRPIR